MATKKVIVLRGEGNGGKTTTLNKLIKKMLSFEKSTFLLGNPNNATFTDEDKDRWVIIKYYDKTVAILTAGDGTQDLSKNFEEISHQFSDPIDIYVCASRSRGKTIEYITKKFKDNVILWERKWDIWREDQIKNPVIEKLRNVSNELQALVLLDTIDKI